MFLTITGEPPPASHRHAIHSPIFTLDRCSSSNCCAFPPFQSSNGATTSLSPSVELQPSVPLPTSNFCHPSPSVLTLALRTVGNIVTIDDLQTQYIIDHGALPCLLSLLTHHHKKSIKRKPAGQFQTSLLETENKYRRWIWKIVRRNDKKYSQEIDFFKIQMSKMKHILERS